MNSSLAVVVLSVAVASAAHACVNTFGEEIRMLRAEGDAAALKTAIAELEKQYAGAPTLENSNDLAVARILQGRLQEAIALLRQVEAKYPGKAIVAANLGTALELAGNDVEALRWIRAGVKRDPEEHEGTEWLHVMILEAKLATAKDPKWLRTHGVLGLDFGSAPQPKLPELPVEMQGAQRDDKAIGSALSYQLGERTTFVDPPDAIVADLYLALANLSHAHYLSVPKSMATPSVGELRFIAGLYESARRYGSPDVALIDAREKQLIMDFPKAFEGTAPRVGVTKP